MNNKELYQWQMTEVKKQFVKIEGSFPNLNNDEVLVKIAGCGVCHTDLSFWNFGVKTKQDLPLTLGHEISGTVVKGDPNWLHKNVIIPAVLPCGECDFCKNERSNVCRNQQMPGNDFHGGFASHIKVPSRFLCHVPDSVLDKYPLEHLSVIADAISTPYQVIKKSEIQINDIAIVIGVGGVGIYGALIAKIFGAKVIALDIKDEKLTNALNNGIDAVLNISSLEPNEIKESVKELVKGLKASKFGWKIFEFSGTKTGQELAFNLMTFASTLSIVGFTMDKVNVRLSNLMAFDAKLIGTWGCRAELYPEVLDLIATDKLSISQFIETFPMSQINEVFSNTLSHKYTKRSVLIPE